MTPERKAWWDSLPAEEKRVRMDIDEFKRMIKHNKKHLIPYVAFAKYCIRYSKKAIKALRKEIAQRPVTIKIGDIDFVCCPKCKHEVFGYYCEQCGQKLRW